MKKINNTAIVKARQDMFDLVNTMLSDGMPIAVVDMVLDFVSSQVKVTLQKHIEQEKSEELAEQEILNSQVEWTEEENK